MRFHRQPAILPVRELFGFVPNTSTIFFTEQGAIKKLSAAIGVVQNGTLRYEDQQQHITATIGTPAWYAWLETARTFRFECAEGAFTAHKERAGNRRGDWYWRAYRRKLGQLSRCYLGVSTNLTLSCLHEAARLLATRSEGTPDRKEASEQKREPEVLLQTTASPVVVPRILILDTKLAFPRLPVQHVSRPNLLAFLEQGMQRPVVLVSASAGSGKTTLLAEWAATTSLPVAWLSCESADNDPARFLSYLLAQFLRLDERVTHVDLMDQFWYAHDYERVLTGPLNDLARLLTRDAVVILDDYHLITTDTIHAMLLFLLDHLPTHLHLVIGTRVDPPLPLARLRMRDQLSEIRGAELHFAINEVIAFARAMKLSLSGEALSLLHARTEGWIAGVQLLVLALRGQANATTFLRTVGNAHRFLLDYVGEEVLAQQPIEMQRFLLRTSILEQLTAPLCDAITEESGNQAQLTAAVRANLFVSALDDKEIWYRYHPLFAEALRARLHILEPHLVPELYRRASHWYEQERWQEKACEYALLAGDQEHAAALLEPLILRQLEQGKVQQADQWLAQLSPALVAASPTFWMISALMPMLRAGILGTSEHTMSLLVEKIERQIQAHADAENAAWTELAAVLPLLQAIAALARGDGAGAIALTHAIPFHLARSGSPLSHFLIHGRLGVLGAAYGASGNLIAAEQLFSAPQGTDVDRLHNLAVVPSLADMYEADGALHTLGQFYDDLFEELAHRAEPASPMFSITLYGRYARLLYEWNRLVEAEQALQQSMEIVECQDQTLPMLPIFSLLNLSILGHVALARGDSQRAEQLLERVRSLQVVFQRHKQQVAEHWQRMAGTLQARLALACGQLESAVHWGAVRKLRFDDAISLQLTAPQYLDAITFSRVLLAQGRTQRDNLRLHQAVSLLQRLHILVSEKHWRGRLIEIEMLLALVLQAQGHIKRALATLGPALAQAEVEGYIRLFADEGPSMTHLLAHISAYTTASASYIQHLQAALVAKPFVSASLVYPAPPQWLSSPLSPREQEVLALLAQGLSNQHIAEHLVISLNTVKCHVKHLLAKLVVTNRTQALVRARELHLLPLKEITPENTPLG